MKILAIETSCDETAVAVVEVRGSKTPKFKVLGNALYSQAKLHEQYGGVFPNLARREHQKNLIPLLLSVLKETKLLNSNFKIRSSKQYSKSKINKMQKVLVREPELLASITDHLLSIKPPRMDRIAFTVGPGLEPALWVGINFAKALSILWNIPVVPVNHMKGHFLAPLAEGKSIQFPALGLLISGGHTELVLAKDPLHYKMIGATRDDAAGEAYDKVARILGLPYPGGPQIARLAETARKSKRDTSAFILPRPMINTREVEFSFSGLKTAVLYMTQKIAVVDEKVKEGIAKEFEEAVRNVLVAKTKLALSKVKARTLIIGGGVSANTYIKASLKNLAKESGIKFLASSKNLATDNAVMIGVAGYYTKTKPLGLIKAKGNLSLTR